MAEICVVLRNDDGVAQANVPVNVWTTPAGTTRASLYNDRTCQTAVANPLSSDSDGLLRCFTTDAAVYYTTALQTEPLPLPTIGNDGDVWNVKDFGAVGDGVTDDTAAFAAAIAAQKAQENATYDILPGWHRSLSWPIRIPAGQYVITMDRLKIDYRNAVFLGAGRGATWLIANESVDDTGPMFEIGGQPFSDDPNTDFPTQTLWAGSRAQGAEFHDLAIVRLSTDSWYYGHTCDRHGIAIQDNGAGNVYTWNVLIRGFEFGFASPYGHDFGYHYNLEIMNCDTGLYLAFGSEQIQFFGLNVGCCNENIVLESVLNVMFYGVNTSTPTKNANCTHDAHDITFIGHYTSGETSRMGVSSPGWGACRAISFYNLWEERAFDRSDDGGAYRAATAISSYIYFTGTNAPMQVQFYDPIISYKKWPGESFSAINRSWLAFDPAATHMQGSTVNVYNPWFAQHTGFDTVLDFLQSAVQWWDVNIENMHFSGQTQDYKPLWVGYPSGAAEPPVGGCFTFRDLPSHPGNTVVGHAYESRLNLLGHAGRGIELGAQSNELDIAGINLGTITNGFRFYPSFSTNGLLAFGNCSSARKSGITTASAQPSSGTWVTGDIVFSTTPSGSGKIGWVCTSGGTPGTWKTWGAIDA